MKCITAWLFLNVSLLPCCFRIPHRLREPWVGGMVNWSACCAGLDNTTCGGVQVIFDESHMISTKVGTCVQCAPNATTFGWYNRRQRAVLGIRPICEKWL